MNQSDHISPRHTKKTTAQKKKATAKKALILMGLICVLGTLALLALPPHASSDSKSSKDADVQDDLSTQTTIDSSTPSAKKSDEQPSVSSGGTIPDDKNRKTIDQSYDTPRPAKQTEHLHTQQPSSADRPQKSAPVNVGPTKSDLDIEPSKKIPDVVQPISPRIEPQPKKKHAGFIIFVFDDAGHNLAQLKPFLDLPFPATIAVLPGLPKSVEAAVAIRRAGKELILHQPMQAVNLNIDPGPGAIKPGMTFSAITDILLENIAQIGTVVGINNHEGSLITQDDNSMRAVLEFCRDHGLYYLDSRTIATSVAQKQAAILNMQIWERSVFLDNTQDDDDILAAVRSGLAVAEKKGNVVMIGHIWSNTLAQTLTELYPELIREGYSMTTIAQIAGYGE